MGDFILNILSGGIVGGFASYVASKYFQKKNNEKNQPKLTISNCLIEKSRSYDNKPAVSFKLINYTDQDISNVIIELEGLEDLAPSDSIPLLRLKKLATKEILYIRKFDSNDSEYFHNAHQILLTNDNDLISDVKQFDFVRISVFATCPYYGTTAIVSNDFKISTKLLNNSYSFNTGNSIDAHM
jgi:hypothetical protein